MLCLSSATCWENASNWACWGEGEWAQPGCGEHFYALVWAGSVQFSWTQAIVHPDRKGNGSQSSLYVSKRPQLLFQKSSHLHSSYRNQEGLFSCLGGRDCWTALFVLAVLFLSRCIEMSAECSEQICNVSLYESHVPWRSPEWLR